MLKRWMARLLGRRYFIALDPGGIFIPGATCFGYVDRRGKVHIETVTSWDPS